MAIQDALRQPDSPVAAHRPLLSEPERVGFISQGRKRLASEIQQTGATVTADYRPLTTGMEITVVVRKHVHDVGVQTE